MLNPYQKHAISWVHVISLLRCLHVSGSSHHKNEKLYFYDSLGGTGAVQEGLHPVLYG